MRIQFLGITRLRVALILLLALPVWGLVLPKGAESATWPTRFVTISSGELSVWSGEGASSRLSLPAPAYAADISDDGKTLVASTGVIIPEDAGGVAGQVIAIDLEGLETFALTAFPDAVITHVALSPGETAVAFVKDYSELWVMDLPAGGVRKILDSKSLSANLGSMFFEPAFACDGSSIYVGLVEKNFAGGEDDKLDNIWSVSLDGSSVRKITSFAEGAAEEDWLIVRSPVPLSDGSLHFTVSEYRADMPAAEQENPPWTSYSINPAFGQAPVAAEALPPISTVIEYGPENKAAALVYDSESASFDLYSVTLPDNASPPAGWCGAECVLYADDISFASVAEGDVSSVEGAAARRSC